jgi:hypothetical protein
VLLFYFIPQFKIAPKTILILNSLIFGIFFLGIRKFFLSFFSAHLFEKVAILGERAEVEKLKKEVNEKPFLGYKVIELDFSMDLLDQIKKEGINKIVFTEEFKKDPKFQNLFYNLLFLGVNFLDFPSFYEKISEKIPVTSISKIWFFKNLKEGEKRIYDKFKRVFDVIDGLNNFTFNPSSFGSSLLWQ